MEGVQLSDWSFELSNNSQRQNSNRSNYSVWIEDNNDGQQTDQKKESILRPVLYGFVVGALLCGIALAAVLTAWLKSTDTTVSSTTTTIGLLSTITTTSATSTTSTTASTSSTTSTTATTSSTTSTTTSITSSTSSTSTTSSTTSRTSSTSTTSSTTSRTSSTSTTSFTTTLPPNLLVNPGAETGTLNPWVIGGTGVAEIDDGSINSGYKPNSGDKQFYGGYISRGSTSTLTQNILLLNGVQGYTDVQLDNGTLIVYISFYEQSYTQFLGTDEGQIRLVFRTVNNAVISQKTTPVITCANAWCSNSYSYPLPIGTRSIDYIMIFNLVTGNAIDSYFDDNSLQVY